MIYPLIEQERRRLTNKMDILAGARGIPLDGFYVEGWTHEARYVLALDNETRAMEKIAAQTLPE